ncbi:hypothetical protein ACLOJK_010530 [Asimina triloba]
MAFTVHPQRESVININTCNPNGRLRVTLLHHGRLSQRLACYVYPYCLRFFNLKFLKHLRGRWTQRGQCRNYNPRKGQFRSLSPLPDPYIPLFPRECLRPRFSADARIGRK